MYHSSEKYALLFCGTAVPLISTSAVAGRCCGEFHTDTLSCHTHKVTTTVGCKAATESPPIRLSRSKWQALLATYLMLFVALISHASPWRFVCIRFLFNLRYKLYHNFHGNKYLVVSYSRQSSELKRPLLSQNLVPCQIRSSDEDNHNSREFDALRSLNLKTCIDIHNRQIYLCT